MLSFWLFPVALLLAGEYGSICMCVHALACGGPEDKLGYGSSGAVHHFLRSSLSSAWNAVSASTVMGLCVLLIRLSIQALY